MRDEAHKNNTHGTIKYILIYYYDIIHSQYYVTEKNVVYYIG